MTHVRGKRVAILATNYFEEQELTEPLRALRDAGAHVDVIAPHAGEIKGLRHVDPGTSVPVNLTLDEVRVETYDALVIPGGAINADTLRMESKARNFVTHMLEVLERPVAVMCHGPWLLVSSRLVRGRKLTSYYTLQDDIQNAGGEWVDQEVVVDDNLITSRQPDDLPSFIEAIMQALGQDQKPSMKPAM